MRRIDILRALAATGCALPALPAGAQTLTKMSVGLNAASDISPILWAKTSGMFTRAGLDVDVQKFSSGTVAIAAVIGGSLDVARASLLPLINAYSHGIPIAILAPADLSATGSDTQAMVVPKDSPITSGKQLNGATMPVPSLGDFNTISTRSWIDATGGDSSTVKFIELPLPSIGPAVVEGRVPAAMVTNPFLSEALAQGKIKMIGRPDETIAKRFLITCYVTTKTWVAAHREAAAAFAQTLNAAATYTAAHHSEVLTAVAPFWGIPASVISAMPIQPFAHSLDPKDVQPLIDAAARYGVIPKAFPAEQMIGVSGK
jgi:NitT/TauT family transport system substrate-binding protein